MAVNRKGDQQEGLVSEELSLLLCFNGRVLLRQRAHGKGEARH